MARYARPDSAYGTFSLFAGKAYAIFALLFGLTFFLQNDRQKREGKDFGWRFLWRMLMLAVFATLNAAFFPAGDVLMLFAAVSIVLLITRNWSDRARWRPCGTNGPGCGSRERPDTAQNNLF